MKKQADEIASLWRFGEDGSEAMNELADPISADQQQMPRQRGKHRKI